MSRAPGASSGARTSGVGLREDAQPEQKRTTQPEDDVARAPKRDERRAGEGHEQPDVDVAVSVLADEDDHHRVQCDPDEECAAHRGSGGADRNEREVERYDDGRLDEDQVHAKQRQERDVDASGRAR